MKKIIYILILFLLWNGIAVMAIQPKSNNTFYKALRYYEAESFPEAMNLFTQTLSEAEKNHDDLTAERCIGYISNIYFNYGDYNRNLHYLLKGYNMAKENGHDELAASFVSNIVTCYCKLGELKKAQQYYKIALESEKDNTGGERITYFLIYNKARIQLLAGKPDEALRYHNEALTYARKKRMKPVFVLYQLSEIGNIYLRTGRYDQALVYGKRCEQMAKRVKSQELLANAYEMLADSYQAMGDTMRSKTYNQLYSSTCDSVYNFHRLSSASTQLFQYENQKNDEHINSLNGIINAQLYVIVLSVVLLVVLLVFIIVVGRKNRKLSEAQKLLVEKNHYLEKAEQDSKRLLEKYVDNDNDQQRTTKTGTTQTSVNLDDRQKDILLGKVMKVMDDVDVISNSDFNLNKLAEMVGSNTRYVSWVINETYGRNFKTILNENRIREAARKLLDKETFGSQTIQAIFESVGYNNAMSFNRAFKKVIGMTPSEYVRIKQTETDKEPVGE